MKIQFLLMLASRVLAALLQAAVFIVLARAVEVDEFGMVGVVLSLGAFACLLSDLGLTAAVSKARAQADYLFMNGALFANDLVTLFTCTAVLVVAVMTPSSVWPLLVALAALLVERNAETGLSQFYAEGRRLVPILSILGRRSVAVGLLLAVLGVGADPLWGFGLGMLAGALFSQAVQRSQSPPQSGAGRLGVVAVVSKSWPYWTSSVSGQVRLLDGAILGVFATTASVGIYAAASRLVNPLMLIPASLSQLVLPYAARSGSTPTGLAPRLLVAAGSSFVLIVPFCFFSAPVMGLVFGSNYESGGAVLSSLLIGLPGHALAGPLSALLQGRGLERLVARNGLIFAVITLGAVPLGALIDGALGVSIAVAVVGLARATALFIPAWRL